MHWIQTISSAPFVHGFLFVALALFPVVNPLGMAPIFLNYTAGLNDTTRAGLARNVALNSFVLATASLVLGSFVLKFFGLNLAAVRIGGGLVVATTGWRLLNQGQSEERERAPNASARDILSGAFYPLTLPLTVGPGSITVMLTLGSNLPYEVVNPKTIAEAGGALFGIVCIAFVVFVCYRYAEDLLRILGESGVNVVLRLSAFILLCIGVQILFDGIRTQLHQL